MQSGDPRRGKVVMVMGNSFGAMCSFAMTRLRVSASRARNAEMLVDNGPPFHVLLNVQQVLETNAPGLAGRSLEHEAAKLGVEHWRSDVGFPGLGSAVGDGEAKRYRLGVAALDVGHAAALAEQLLITGQGLENVCLAQRQADLVVLVVVGDDEVLDLHDTSFSAAARREMCDAGTLPRHPTAWRRAPWPLHGAILRAVAAEVSH